MSRKQPAPTNLSVARTYVKENARYFSKTLFAFVPQPVEGLTNIIGGPMAVTEGLVLLYDPEWVKTESVDVIAYGLVHEILHDQLKHIARGKKYDDPKLVNVAGDLVIYGLLDQPTRLRKIKDPKNPKNVQMVQEKTWKAPEWALKPEDYGFQRGLTMDAYYRLLKQLQQSKQNHQQKGRGSDPASSGQQEGPSQQGSGSGSSDTGQPAPPQDKPKVCAGSCGGVAGNPTAKELESKIDQVKGRSESDKRRIRKETARDIRSAVQGSGIGTLPSTVCELLEPEEVDSYVPWEQYLSVLMRNSLGRISTGGMDYSSRRPSKRSYLRGMVLPGLIKRDPNVMVALDTSGSMGSHKELPAALGEIAKIFRQTGVDSLWMLQVDAAVQVKPHKITVHDLQTVEIVGRGGTSFVPAFDAIEEMEPQDRPDLLIYLTDGGGGAPTHPPDNLEVIWCIIPTGHAMTPAPWGELVIMDDNTHVHQRFGY